MMIKSKTKKTMNSPTSGFNPARLNDQIDESLYATGLGKGTKLKNGRQHRVDWLRKKFKDDQPCQTLADKLHSCKPQARCKSPACPECAYAARRLLTTTIKKYLSDQSKAGNSIVCLSIVPADGITNPGQLTPD
jgi:hypothetical protein